MDAQFGVFIFVQFVAEAIYNGVRGALLAALPPEDEFRPSRLEQLLDHLVCGVQLVSRYGTIVPNLGDAGV